MWDPGINEHLIGVIYLLVTWFSLCFPAFQTSDPVRLRMAAVVLGFRLVGIMSQPQVVVSDVWFFWCGEGVQWPHVTT